MVFNGQNVNRSRQLANPDRLQSAAEFQDQRVSFTASGSTNMYSTSGVPVSGDDNRVHPDAVMSGNLSQPPPGSGKPATSNWLVLVGVLAAAFFIVRSSA